MSTSLTYLDIAKMQTADGTVPPFVEILNQRNDIVTDIGWKQTNQMYSDLAIIRTGLPSVYYRIMNQGVAISSSTTVQVTEDCAKMEAWAEVDQENLRRSGDPGAVKTRELAAFAESMRQTLASKLFYGNASVDPEEFTGLHPRYSAISGATNGHNIIDGGGDGSDNMSLWVIRWGENVTGLVPKGMPTGIQQSAWETATKEASNTANAETRMVVERAHLEWYHGLEVVDWRDVARVANVSRAALAAGTVSMTDLLNDALDLPHSGTGKPPVIYMRRDAFSFLRRERTEGVLNGGGVTYENVDGMGRQPIFGGIARISICDALLDTEGSIS